MPANLKTIDASPSPLRVQCFLLALERNARMLHDAIALDLLSIQKAEWEVRRDPCATYILNEIAEMRASVVARSIGFPSTDPAPAQTDAAS